MSPAVPAQRNGIPPGYPADYYQSIFDAEERHWWHAGMRDLSLTLLGERLTGGGDGVLDAGCGTGGFLAWALGRGPFRRAAGVDISAAGVELARTRLPAADLRVASVSELPFDSESFDLVICNDVLQHVPEPLVARSLEELRRVLAPTGALLLRTNGAWRTRREREDWRAYDRPTVARLLRAAGLECRRLTHVNMAPSLWELTSGQVPHAPTEHSHGVAAPPGRVRSVLAAGLLRVEARYLARPGRRLPYGHTQLAVAVPAP